VWKEEGIKYVNYKKGGGGHARLEEHFVDSQLLNMLQPNLILYKLMLNLR
jgi:hypothetical protein